MPRKHFEFRKELEKVGKKRSIHVSAEVGVVSIQIYTKDDDYTNGSTQRLTPIKARKLAKLLMVAATASEVVKDS